MSSKKDRSNPWNERRLARGTAGESETPVLHPHHQNELTGHFYFFFVLFKYTYWGAGGMASSPIPEHSLYQFQTSVQLLYL